MSDSELVVSNLQNLLTGISDAEREFGRQPGSVRLLAVSKKKPAHLIEAAHSAGQLEFGENYAEEGTAKCAELNNPALVWHFIGGIQSNKTRQIANTYDWVQSVDRLKIARRLSDQRSPDRTPLNVCIQVNVDAEEGKAGCEPQAVLELARQINELDRLVLRGVMAIPLASGDENRQRQSFRALSGIYAELCREFPQIDTLSMGMTGDMRIAIAEGSTMVRIGTALFGERTAR